MLAFKRSGIIGLVAALAIAMAGCGSTGSGKSASSSSKEKPTDLSGQWIQEDADSDSYQAGVISNDTITIYWVSDGGKTQDLYWAGSYKAPTKQVKEYSWTSKVDHSQTDNALLASGDDTKDFTYKNGKISYEASALGTTKTMVLVKNEDQSKFVGNKKKTESESSSSESSDKVDASASSQEVISNDTKKSNKETIINVDNNTDFANLIQNSDGYDSATTEFSKKYDGKEIEFDGYIAAMDNHDNYKTRYDILLYAGNNDEDSHGPAFQFNDVGMSDLNLQGNVPDSIGYGTKLHVKAKVGKADVEKGLFFLEPVENTIRE